MNKNSRTAMEIVGEIRRKDIHAEATKQR